MEGKAGPSLGSQWLRALEEPGSVTFYNDWKKPGRSMLGLGAFGAAVVFVLSASYPRNPELPLILWISLPCLTLLVFCSIMVGRMVHEIRIDLESRQWSTRFGMLSKLACDQGSLDDGARVVTEYGEFHKNLKQYGYASVVLDLGKLPRQELDRFPKMRGHPVQISPHDVETAIRIGEDWARKLGVPFVNGI